MYYLTAIYSVRGFGAFVKSNAYYLADFLMEIELKLEEHFLLQLLVELPLNSYSQVPSSIFLFSRILYYDSSEQTPRY